MARPNKLNADYHSHDKDMRNDLAIKALRKRYGHEGYSVYNMMLEVLTGSDNWQHPWNEKTIELLAADFDSNKLKEIIGYATETLDLFVIEDGYIFSNGHKKRFLPLLNKRKRQSEGFSTAKTPQKEVFDSESTHSKVKYSKVKNSIDIEPEANQANVEFASPLQTIPQPEIQVAPPAAPVDRSLLGVVVYDAEQAVLSNQIEFERICMVTKTSRQNALESLRLYHLHLQEKERYPMGKKAVFAGFEKWLMDPYGFSKEAKNRKSSNQDTPPVKQFNGGGLAKMRAIQKEYEEKVKREAGNG